MNNINWKKTLTAHVVVKNEDVWIYFAILSVINYVDKMIIFDNGSTDNTVNIINEIMKNELYANKIHFECRPSVSPNDFYKLRQEQIEMTNTDYLMVLDGDEIWWKDSMIELRNILDTQEPDYVTTHFVNCGGDIFHYRDNKRELYCQKTGIGSSVVGAYTSRVFSTGIDGLHVGGEYGIEGYKDKDNKDIQNNHSGVFMKLPYLHTSTLRRSTNKNSDFSVMFRKEKQLFRSFYDYKFPKNFKYPEILYEKTPLIVPSPWKKNFSILYVVCQSLHNLKMFLSKKQLSKQLDGKEY